MIERILRYIANRLKELSTYPALVLVLSACGVAISPEQKEVIIAVGMGLAGLIGAALPDRLGHNSRQDDPKPPEDKQTAP